MSEKKVAKCPLVEWYEFEQCEIRTCKNYTSETQRHCLELDRKKPEGAKQFSDAELNLYKFKSRGISTRLVQIHRKNAIQGVKAILILREYIEWLSENYKDKTTYKDKSLLALEGEYPLKVKRLGWKNWMWEYLLNESIWQKFIAVNGGECSTFDVHQLLGIKLSKFESLLRNFNQKEIK